MPKRDDLFQKFGPLLTEAFALLHFEEANRVRRWLGKPEITKQDVLDELNNHLSELQPYDWMHED